MLQSERKIAGAYGGRRHLPNAFTEHGAIMLASVVNTQQAIELKVVVIRAFNESRENTFHVGNFSARLDRLESQGNQILHALSDLKFRLSNGACKSVQIEQPLLSHYKASENEKIEKIIKTVGEYFKQDPEAFPSTQRSNRLALSRQIAMYLVRENLNISYKEIGLYFGGRDHSTVIYAEKKIGAKMKVDPQIREAIQTIQGLLSGQLS